MGYNDPTIADFKTKFARDFPFGSTPETVNDSDIANAYATTTAVLNPALFGNQQIYTLGYLLLAAHHLVTALRASSQGVAGSYSWLTASKSVGSVSESFSIPQRILDNPVLALLAKTNYGVQYLELILPKLVGQSFAVCGRTLP